MIPVFEPYFSGNEKRYLNECIDTGWISSQGKFVRQFEESLAAYFGVKFAIVTSNCTSALFLALKGLGIAPGDGVICPNLTFIAPANMIVETGADLQLVDIDPQTLTLDPKAVESAITANTKAIVVVHQFGHACHMDDIMDLAKRKGLAVVEDNAESMGGYFKNQKLGAVGDVGVVSFFGNKIMTSGEGGCLLTDNEDIANTVKILRDHGMSRTKRYHHLHLGYNFRMTNMQAAIGLAQLERIDHILALRNAQMKTYYELLDGLPGIDLRRFANWCSPVHWLMTLSLADEATRDRFISFLAANGVEARPMINPVNHAEHFLHLREDDLYRHSVQQSAKSCHLPSGTGLKDEEIEHIANVIGMFLE